MCLEGEKALGRIVLSLQHRKFVYMTRRLSQKILERFFLPKAVIRRLSFALLRAVIRMCTFSGLNADRCGEIMCLVNIQLYDCIHKSNVDVQGSPPPSLFASRPRVASGGWVGFGKIIVSGFGGT